MTQVTDFQLQVIFNIIDTILQKNMGTSFSDIKKKAPLVSTHVLEDNYRIYSCLQYTLSEHLLFFFCSLVANENSVSFTVAHMAVCSCATSTIQISPFLAPPTHTCTHALTVQPPADAHCTSISHITSLLRVFVPSHQGLLTLNHLAMEWVANCEMTYRHNTNSN